MILNIGLTERLKHRQNQCLINYFLFQHLMIL